MKSKGKKDFRAQLHFSYVANDEVRVAEFFIQNFRVRKCACINLRECILMHAFILITYIFISVLNLNAWKFLFRAICVWSIFSASLKHFPFLMDVLLCVERLERYTKINSASDRLLRIETASWLFDTNNSLLNLKSLKTDQIKFYTNLQKHNFQNKWT